MRKEWTDGFTCDEYQYRGFYIYKLTRNDWCMYGADGKMMIHEKTLKAAKARVDELCKIFA